LLLRRKKKFADERETLEGEGGESHSGFLVAGWW
jgi:hypothetical protein